MMKKLTKRVVTSLGAVDNAPVHIFKKLLSFKDMSSVVKPDRQFNHDMHVLNDIINFFRN